MTRTRPALVLAAVALLALALVGCSSSAKNSTPKNSPELAPKLLTAKDLPPGWKATPSGSDDASPTDCLKEFANAPKNAGGQARAGFAKGTSFPALSESIYSFTTTGDASGYLTTVNQQLSSCTSFSYTQNKVKVTGQITPLQLSSLGGDTQKSYKMTLSAPGSNLAFLVLLVRDGADVMALSYGGTETLNTAQATELATTATKKLAAAPTSTS